MISCGILLVLLNFSPDVDGMSQKEINRHLELGRDFLAKGQLQDALTQYHAAIEGDPNNYLTYYKRGVVYFAMERPKFALQDFDKVLRLKPDFTAAQLHKADVLLKQGLFDESREAYKRVLENEPNNDEVWKQIEKIGIIESNAELAKSLYESKQFDEAANLLSRVIEVVPWSSEYRELRAETYVAVDDNMNAINDYYSATKLHSDDTEGHFKLSKFLYKLGFVNKAMKEIRNCLKYDPEHKDCFPFYKSIKKVAKHLSGAAEAREQTDYSNCITSAKQVLKLEQKLDKVRHIAMGHLCKCLAQDEKYMEAIKYCEDAIKIQEDLDLLCDTAEAYLAAELFDDAIRYSKNVLETDSNFQRAKELYQTAQQRQKISETRDYYKILNVPRNAKKKDIIKAYRKAAQKWHPDNFQEGKEKEKAQKKFIDIATAKEILTDEEKRAKFDRGEDPADPESGKHHGFHNPFQEFHHFQGSPFQFKFQFN